jgi:thiol-disulfide isomerase/thioredoxin
MPFLVATVVLVGAVCLLNTLLIFAVFRRLREQDALIAARPASSQPGLLEPGSVVDDFIVTTAAGERIGRTDLPAGSVVGFFSPTCGPCREHIPDFLSRANPAAGRPGLAVVIGSPAETAEMAALLAPAGRVVVEADHGVLVNAFSATGFPAFYLMADGGAISANGRSLTSLANPVLA